MKRLFIALVVFCLAASAHAATLTTTPDALTQGVGDSLTLTVVGDSQGAAATGIFGRLLFDPVVFTGISTSQNTLTSFGGVLPWLLGPITCGIGYCDVFNQIGELVPYPVDNLLTAQVMLLVIGDTTGTEIHWETAQNGFQLDFFGLTDAEGVIFPVPEPTTATLLALGLVGLSAIRRRRHA